MKYLKSLLFILASLIILALLISTFSYFNILKHDYVKYFNLVAMILSVLIGSIYLGLHSDNKGYLEGMKISGILIAILILLSYLGFDKGISLESIVFYLIILVSAITGSIVGINKKIERKA